MDYGPAAANFFPGAFYHATARGNERKAVFKSIRDRQKFLEYLGRYKAILSVLLGSPDFIEFIKGTYLSDKKPVREVSAIRQLAPRITCQTIVDRVESEFVRDPVTARSIKLYLAANTPAKNQEPSVRNSDQEMGRWHNRANGLI